MIRRWAADPGRRRRGRGHTAGSPVAWAHCARRGPEPGGGAHQQGDDRDPARFAGVAQVHPDIDKTLTTWERPRVLAADVEAYVRWMRDDAKRRIGHLCPEATGRLDPLQIHPACPKPHRAHGTGTGADVPA